MKKTITTSFTLALILMAFAVNVMGQSIQVHTSNYKQIIDMIGGDMERSSKAIQSAQNKDDIIQWSFGDINFNFCRVQYDKNQEMVEGTKDWSFYDKQVATMQAIKAVNPDIKFFATMRSDYDGYGNDNNLPDWICDYSNKDIDADKYGVFLADYVEYMENQGVAIEYISTVKEWYWFLKGDEAEAVILKLKSELATRGVAMPKICDQGTWSITQGIKYVDDVTKAGTKDLYDSFCIHNYDNEGMDEWLEMVEKSTALGKKVYDDETSTGSGSPTYGVERAMYKPIDEYKEKSQKYEAGLCGEIYFEIWSRGIDKETRSIYFPSGGTGTRLRGYYIMKHFANNVLNGRYVTTTLNSLSKVYTIQVRKDDEVVLWVINENTAAYPLVPVTVDAAEIDGDIAVHYWTDNTSVEGVETTNYANGNVFEIGIPSESISCYIFKVNDEKENIAVAGTATQSSTEGSLSASLAIDADAESVSQTTIEENPWWQVDLGANDTIGSINLMSTTGISDSFTVSVIDDENNVTFTKTYTSAISSSLTVDAGNAIGKVIKVQLNGTAALSLSEVEIQEGQIITKYDQTISFPATRSAIYSTDELIADAVASSGLGVNYSSSNTSVLTISDGKISLKGVGTSIITASIGESLTYNAAEDATQTFTVTKAEQTITFPSIDSKKVGDASFVLVATASSGLDVTFSSSDESVASMDGNRVLLHAEGLTIITASQAGDNRYDSAEKERVLIVGKADSVTDTPTDVLLPVNDSYVRGGQYSSDIYGADAELLLKETSNGDFLRKTYLQFDLYDMGATTGIEKVLLRLYAATGKESHIVVYSTSDEWTEETLNYSNAPSQISALADQTVSASGVYYEWDVTSYVLSSMTSDDVASFVVADISTNKNSIAFNSKEAADNLPHLFFEREEPAALQNIENADYKVSIFPNPASGYVNVKADNTISSIKVLSLLGQELLCRHNVGTKEVQLNLDAFNSGVYLFQVFDVTGYQSTLRISVE